MAHGIGLVWPEKRKADVYRKISAWHDYSFTTFPYCLSRLNDRILLANSNQWYFNNLVKKPCHKTHYRCPHCLNLSFRPGRSCALPNIKMLKDKDLEFANSIRPFSVDKFCL